MALPELEQHLLDTYYEFRGFNSDGVPTVESLVELGLAYVAKDFEERGIYAEGESADDAS